MPGRLGASVLAAGGAAWSNLRNPRLRRAQAAFGGAWTAEWAFTVALSVVAFREGGAAAVGLVALLRMLPSAALAPVIATYADRFRRERVLVASSAARAVATAGATAALVADVHVWVVYALAVVSTIAVTPYRAAHSALLPCLCNTVDELTASNVVRGMLDSVSVLVGPLGAAVLLQWASVEAVFASVAVFSALSGLVISNLRYEAPPRDGRAERPRLRRELAAGARAVASDGDLRLMFALAAVQTFTRGCLTVSTVVVAIDLLGTGEPGVGLLTAAVGVGAVVGSLGAALLIGNRALARFFGASVALWGAPLALIALEPSQLVAVLALAVVGIANAVLDVGLFTLVPRLVAEEVLARVFGVMEALIAVAVGVGSILTPVLIELAGTRGALAIVGALGPAAVLLAWLRLRRLDAEMGLLDDEIGLLREVELLRTLPMPTIDHLARHAELLRFDPGEVVFAQGHAGDRFYVIAGGEAEVAEDAAAIAALRRGECFGEMALLRDAPRMGTVTATTALTAYAIERHDFLRAVNGYSSALGAATELVAQRTRRPATEAALPA